MRTPFSFAPFRKFSIAFMFEYILLTSELFVNHFTRISELNGYPLYI